MIKAVFTAKVDEIKIRGLMQWDRGQMLEITCPDLPDEFQVHFTNRARGTAIPVRVAGASDTARVAIPDELLREPYEVLAYLYFTDGETEAIGETVKTIRMPVTPRVQPEDYVLDLPQEQLTDAELVIAKMMDTYATQAADTATAGALAGINDALNNLPEGDTLVINDLTTGGESAALSAEMGKVLGRKPNPNLLDNAYFLRPVNQKGQDVYAVTNNGSRKHAIDRWMIRNADGNLTITDGGIRIENTSTDKDLYVEQNIVPASAEDRKTVSILIDDVEGSATVYVSYAEGGFNTSTELSKGLVINRVIAGKSIAKVCMRFSAGARATLRAAKLEYGSEQTLAHQDANGNWVLNEVPDYGEELLKCQHYYQLFSSEDAMPTNPVDFRPTMRANPATGTIDINGVTYWYADANL